MFKSFTSQLFIGSFRDNKMKLFKNEVIECPNNRPFPIELRGWVAPNIQVEFSGL